MINKRLNDAGQDEAVAFTNRLGSVVLLSTAVFAVLSIGFAPTIVKITAPGLTAEAHALSVSLTRILLPGLLFSALAHMAAGILHSVGEFGIPAARGLPLNFIIVGAVLVFGSTYGVHVLAWAYLAGLCAEFVIQVPALMKHRFRFRWMWAPADPSIREAALLMAPVIAGTALVQVNTVASRIFASTLSEGSISVIEYSNRLVALVTGVVITAVATVMLADFSRLAAQERKDELGLRVGRAVSGLNALVLPMAVGLILLSTPITRFVYERGAFTPEATKLTALALSISGASLVGCGLRDVVTRAFYALNDTKTPMINSIVAMGLNVALLFIFVSWLDLGVAGMALAATCSMTWAGFSLTIRFHRLGHRMDLVRILGSTWRTCVATMTMAAVVWLTNPLMDRLLPGAGFFIQAVRLGVCVGVGGMVYVLALTGLKSEEARQGWAMLGSLRRKIAGLTIKHGTASKL